MSTAVERLQSIRVADVMTRNVVTVSANSTMAEAVRILAQHQVSGLPVVNELAQCVGILSTTDFARRDQSHNSSNALATPASEHLLVRDEGEGPFQIEYVAENLVSQHMSSAPQTIDAKQSLVDAARYMQGGHIHRLVVVDQRAGPVGVISSLDIIAALVNSLDEQAAEDSRCLGKERNDELV